MKATMMRSASSVRVVVPASAAFNLDKFTKLTRDLAERLGCKPCLSGVHCQFLLERDFVVNPAGKIEAGPLGGPGPEGGL